MKHLFTLATLAAASLSASADDWPNYRGPTHDGISAEKGWKSQWDDEPKVLWKKNVGIGFSSFSVAKGKAYTAGWDDEKDTVICFDAATGAEVWKHSYPADLGDKYYEGGTSATPTIADGAAYWLGRWGDLIAFDAASGKVRWQKNVQKETGANIPDWGYAGSVLVHGKLLIVNVGEAGTAVDKSDGRVVWKSGPKSAGYSTPKLAKVEGKECVLLASGKSYVAVDPSSGAKQWEYPWPTAYDINAAAPIPLGNEVFISSGYDQGATLLKVSGGSPSSIWRNKEMRNQFNSSVLIDGYVYGVDGNDRKNASLKCLDWKTGKTKWERKNYGPGSLMAAVGKLICLSERGELIIAEASPDKFTELGRMQVLSGKCWTAPVLANGRIYCRNAAGAVVCLDVSGK